MRADRRRRARHRSQQAPQSASSAFDRDAHDRHRRAGRRARPAQCLAQAARRLVSGRCQHVGAGHAGRHGGQQFLRLALDRLRQHGAQRARDRRDACPTAPRRASAPKPRWPAAPPRIAELLDELRAIGERERDEIERSVPKVLRRVGGYNIDVFLPAERAAVHSRRQRQLSRICSSAAKARSPGRASSR